MKAPENPISIKYTLGLAGVLHIKGRCWEGPRDGDRGRLCFYLHKASCGEGKRGTDKHGGTGAEVYKPMSTLHGSTRCGTVMGVSVQIM